MPISSSAYAAGKQPQRTHHWLPQSSSNSSTTITTATSHNKKPIKQSKMRSKSSSSGKSTQHSTAKFTKIALISEPSAPNSTSATSNNQQQSLSSLTLAGKTTTLLSPRDSEHSTLKPLHQPLPLPASISTLNGSEQTTQRATAATAAAAGRGTASNAASTSRQLLFKRALHLKHVKGLLLTLMSIDLIITVLVHQLAEGDQLSLWWWLGGRRVKLSLINLIVTGVWLALLCAGLLFDLYAILFGSAALHLASFGLLLSLSALHFSRQIDYSTVQLAPLLGLLFAVVALHVYLLVMATLTIYLMLAVRRRQKCI